MEGRRRRRWEAVALPHPPGDCTILVHGGVVVRMQRADAADQGGRRLGDVRREISIMKRLRHRNLVSLVEVIDDPSSDRLFLVQELAGKGSVLPV